MKVQSLVAALGAACLVAAVTAQTNCPQQTTQNQPESLRFGPPKSCGGFSGQVGDIKIMTPGGVCPTFALITPAHQLAVPTANRTMVQPAGQSPITLLEFGCQLDWFLIIPYSTSCGLISQSNVGTVQHLVTVPCP
jgi:hypothetical protein